MEEKTKKALIIVDVQNDFCPGGALAVPEGDKVVPVIVRLLNSGEFDLWVVSLEWHSEDHCSFVENGGQWPKHCVQDTAGARLHPDLEKTVKKLLHKDHLFVAKGFEKDKESYSVFSGNLNIVKLIKERHIGQVYVCGLATDYCVKATALDSRREGFETFVIINACRGVNVNPGDVSGAIEEMKNAGIKIIEKIEGLCPSFFLETICYNELMQMEETNKTRNMPKDVFLHFLNIFTFYLSVVSFITLYIQYINVIFPDQLNFYYTGIANSVRMFTSMMVIAIPVYIFTSWLLGRDLKKNPQKREFQLRKWLVYFTLFISAVTIIVDLIKFVYSFLSGELTIQFILKVATVLLVALAVFGYYIWDLRRKDKETSKTPKKLSFAISFMVLASVIAGFFIIGTPAAQRTKRFDDQRISDLQILQSQIVSYWIRKESLPQGLDDLEESISGFFVPKDPQTDMPYTYKIKGALSFELCADFKTSSKSSRNSKGTRYPYKDSFSQNWDHQIGETCFERTIDPELYKNSAQAVKEPMPAYPIR